MVEEVVVAAEPAVVVEEKRVSVFTCQAQQQPLHDFQEPPGMGGASTVTGGCDWWWGFQSSRVRRRHCSQQAPAGRGGQSGRRARVWGRGGSSRVDSCYLEGLDAHTSISSAVKLSTVECIRSVGGAVRRGVAPVLVTHHRSAVCRVLPHPCAAPSVPCTVGLTQSTKLASAETATMPDQDLASKYMDLPQQGLATMAHTPPYAQPLGYQQPPTPGYNPPSYSFPPMYPQNSYPAYSTMGSYLTSQCPSPSVDGQYHVMFFKVILSFYKCSGQQSHGSCRGFWGKLCWEYIHVRSVFYRGWREGCRVLQHRPAPITPSRAVTFKCCMLAACLGSLVHHLVSEDVSSQLLGHSLPFLLTSITS
ncbi:hypothetical protein E2C01_042310 [Portunus trituberculatus]|uniref:Uncharacterized protein n=1 Tax=Portunus trituberculatus TaxID=210409 RepID=A0A5B7FTA4_PORTR|nr:hypothetical protein [Portunus trituberculatus]